MPDANRFLLIVDDHVAGEAIRRPDQVPAIRQFPFIISPGQSVEAALDHLWRVYRGFAVLNAVM